MDPAQALCPICGGEASEFIGSSVLPDDFFRGREGYVIAAGGEARLPVWKCLNCGHGFITPLTISREELGGWYGQAPEDTSFVHQQNARMKTAGVVLSRLERVYARKGKLLDVGCGPGFFLKAAKIRGWQVQGVEPSNWARRWAREYLGLTDVLAGDYTALDRMVEESFDVVCAFDVIEHVLDPSDFLRAIGRVLKPGGMLVLTTPRFDSLFARFTGRKWHAIFPAHLHYFAGLSLTRLLKEAGFSVEVRRTHTRYLSAEYFWRRLMAYLGIVEMKPVNSVSVSLPINICDEFEIYARKY